MRLSPATLVVCLMAAACARDGDRVAADKTADGEDSEAVPVEVVTLESGEIEAILRFSVNLEAERQVRVLGRAPGQVQRLLVEEGAQVKRGEVLLRLQDEEQRNQVARVQHDLARARRLFERQEQLHGRGLVSDQELEAASYDKTRLELALADARLALDHTVVRSPIDGTVSQRLVRLGDFVQIQQPLFQVTDFSSIVAVVFVPEKQAPALRPGLSARVAPQAPAGSAHEGVVDRIAPVIDPASGTVKVTVAIPEHEVLRPGMFVDVELVTERREEALLLPKRALIYESDQPYAFKLGDDGTVERVRVLALLEDRNNVQPEQGFAAGDRVVVAGQVGLKDGAAVRVLPGAAAPEAAAATP